MAFLSTKSFCTPALAASPPRRSLMVARATAKSSEHLEPVANGDSPYSSGRRRAMMLFAAAGTVTAAVSQAARAVPKLGGYEEIKNVSDPYVREISNWAVTKHNELFGGKLQLSDVVRGWKQVVKGMNNKLEIEATGPSFRNIYLTEVFDPLPGSGEERQLNLFDGWVGPLDDGNKPH